MAAGPISERNQGNWGRRAQDGPRGAGVGRSVPEAPPPGWEARLPRREPELCEPGPQAGCRPGPGTGGFWISSLMSPAPLPSTPAKRPRGGRRRQERRVRRRAGRGWVGSGPPVALFAFPSPRTLFLTFCSLASDATVYVGGLDEKVSEPLLWELFLQAGPVVNTHMPKDRVTGQHQGEYWARSSPAWGSRPRQGLLSARASYNSWDEQPAGFFPFRLSSQFVSGVFSQL